VVAYAPQAPAPTIEEMIASYDWDDKTAYAVMINESNGLENSFNPEWHRDQFGNSICQGSYGLFQIACTHSRNPKELFNPIVNIEIAYNLYLNEGWRPWSVCTNGTVDCGL